MKTETEREREREHENNINSYRNMVRAAIALKLFKEFPSSPNSAGSCELLLQSGLIAIHQGASPVERTVDLSCAVANTAQASNLE